MIKGGYVIQARKTDESEIAHKPPHFREIFNWLYRQANHKDNGKFKRGQCLRTISDIQEGLSWFIGYRKKKYSKSICENALKWLRNATMITTTKTTRGMVITICNYDLYQNPQNYESNNETDTKATRTQQHLHTINNNDKNEKINKIFIKPTRQEVTNYAESIDFKLDGTYWVDHYEANGWMVGKNKMKDWKATVRTWKKNNYNNNGNNKSEKTIEYRPA